MHGPREEVCVCVCVGGGVTGGPARTHLVNHKFYRE